MQSRGLSFVVVMCNERTSKSLRCIDLTTGELKKYSICVVSALTIFYVSSYCLNLSIDFVCLYNCFIFILFLVYCVVDLLLIIL